MSESVTVAEIRSSEKEFSKINTTEMDNTMTGLLNKYDIPTPPIESRRDTAPGQQAPLATPGRWSTVIHLQPQLGRPSTGLFCGDMYTLPSFNIYINGPFSDPGFNNWLK